MAKVAAATSDWSPGKPSLLHTALAAKPLRRTYESLFLESVASRTITMIEYVSLAYFCLYGLLEIVAGTPTL